MMPEKSVHIRHGEQPSEEALYRKEGSCHRYTQRAFNDYHLSTARWDGGLVDVDVR
jgi:hypothetical protein